MGNNRIFVQNTLGNFQYSEEIALKIHCDTLLCLWGSAVWPPAGRKFENNTILYGKFVPKFNDKLTTELNLAFSDGHHGTN